jgi:hypothetical protein
MGGQLRPISRSTPSKRERAERDWWNVPVHVPTIIGSLLPCNVMKRRAAI